MNSTRASTDGHSWASNAHFHNEVVLLPRPHSVRRAHGVVFVHRQNRPLLHLVDGVEVHHQLAPYDGALQLPRRGDVAGLAAASWSHQTRGVLALNGARG